jgi:hypothetical protein
MDQVMIERYSDTFIRISANGFVYRGFNVRDVRLGEILVGGTPANRMERLDRTNTDPNNVWHIDKIDKLVIDIDKNGMKKPIWVTKTNKFVDGIHRLWAHILLGKDTIRCLTVPTPWSEE